MKTLPRHNLEGEFIKKLCNQNLHSPHYNDLLQRKYKLA